MKYKAYSKDKKYKLEIEEDESVGFYLFVYDINTGVCIEDHLQDTLDFAMEDAEEFYGVQGKDWQLVK